MRGSSHRLAHAGWSALADRGAAKKGRHHKLPAVRRNAWANVPVAGQSVVEVLVITVVLLGVFWGLGGAGGGVLAVLLSAMQRALTQFANILALPV